MAKKQDEIDTTSIIIEKGIERTKKTHGGRVNKWFYLLVKMQIDDSFAIPFKVGDLEDATKVRNAIVGALRQYKNKNEPSARYSTRILFTKSEIRVWRDN